MKSHKALKANKRSTLRLPDTGHRNVLITMHKFYRPTGPYSPVFFSAPYRIARQLPILPGAGRRLAARIAAIVASCLALAALLTPMKGVAQSMLLPTAEIMVGSQRVHVEVAATETARSQGLMHRTSLPADQGMLFMFDSPGSVCFWMKNTPLPLSIAFISPAGKIINIADMQPHTLDSHCPTGPMLYALEMHQGWFRRHQIKAGATVSGLPRP